LSHEENNNSEKESQSIGSEEGTLSSEGYENDEKESEFNFVMPTKKNRKKTEMIKRFQILQKNQIYPRKKEKSQLQKLQKHHYQLR